MDVERRGQGQVVCSLWWSLGWTAHRAGLLVQAQESKPRSTSQAAVEVQRSSLAVTTDTTASLINIRARTKAKEQTAKRLVVQSLDHSWPVEEPVTQEEPVSCMWFELGEIRGSSMDSGVGRGDGNDRRTAQVGNASMSQKIVVRQRAASMQTR